MKTYILKRLMMILPTMLGITVITFVIIRLAPGDPAAMRIGSGAQGMIRNQQLANEIIEKTRKEFGLDLPIHQQYFRWVGKIATLDFGRSYKDNRPVMDKIWERMPITLQLNIISIILVYLIAIPLGIYSSTHQYSAGDKTLTLGLFILYSLPSFWVATILILFVGGGDYFHWFPITGISSMDADKMSAAAWLWDRIWHLILPVTCLTYGGLAYVSRQMRSGMLETIRQDYIRTARAKGLSEKTVIYKHALRNSLIPIVTLLGFLLPALLGGSVIIESIFTIPGMGALGFEAILSRDYPVVMAISTLAAFLTLIGLLISDICYALVNPTISLEAQ
ncbi:MAG: diguanylate cyclase [Acidobacteria bacterium RIFCSPLOWO2_12_FULL_54_10]|nr:MAG: diguanylate cyclase [Acidobacteria bacterium RIFCSPLOWO2_12_FULL_54_10]